MSRPAANLSTITKARWNNLVNATKMIASSARDRADSCAIPAPCARMRVAWALALACHGGCLTPIQESAAVDNRLGKKASVLHVADCPDDASLIVRWATCPKHLWRKRPALDGWLR